MNVLRAAFRQARVRLGLFILRGLPVAIGHGKVPTLRVHP